jgi:hypothetical protein
MQAGISPWSTIIIYLIITTKINFNRDVFSIYGDFLGIYKTVYVSKYAGT